MSKQTHPIQLTAKAQQYIKGLIAKSAQAGAGLRLSVSGGGKGGCSGYKYHTEIVAVAKEGDLTLVFDEVTLWVPEKDVDALRDLELDYETIGPGQMRLVFNNPQATNVCGCGESFSLAAKTPVANPGESA